MLDDLLQGVPKTSYEPKGMANYSPIGPELEGHAPVSVAEMEPGFWEYAGPQAAEALEMSPSSAFIRSTLLATAQAERGGLGKYGRFAGPDAPRPHAMVTNAAAKDEIARAGVKLDIGEGPVTRPALDIMLARAHTRAVRADVIAAYDPGLLTQFGVSAVASLADPLNLAAGFVPVTAGWGFLAEPAVALGGRIAQYAGRGLIEGVAGAAIVEPIIGFAATQEGRDYTYRDALQALVFGGVFGTALHTSVGGFREVIARTAANAPIVSPLDVVDRLTPEAKGTALRATVADMIDGREVSTSDVIDVLTARDKDLAGRVTYENTLRRDGPAIDDTTARIDWWSDKLKGKTTPAAKAGDFMAWVRSQGGVKDDGSLAAAGIARGDLPSSVYLTAKGATRTDRGVAFDDLYAKAQAEGFVSSRQEFIDAFRAGRKGSPLAPITRAADRDIAATRADEAKHVAELLTDAGVSPNASNSFKARALVAREQSIVFAERQRIAGAEGRLEARRDSMRPASPVQPAPEPRETASELAELLDREEAAPPAPKAPQDRKGDLEKPGDGAGAAVGGEAAKPAAKALPPALARLVAEVDTRRAAIDALLDPESRRALDNELARLDAEEADLAKVYDSALACLIGD